MYLYSYIYEYVDGNSTAVFKNSFDYRCHAWDK